MRKLWALVPIIVLWTACSRSPYPGYKSLGGDLYFRLITLGEGDRVMNDSDHVALVIRASSGNAPLGSLYSSEMISEAWPLLGTEMAPALKRSHQGDSLSMWLPAAKVPWERLGCTKVPVDTGMVRVDLAVKELKTSMQMHEEAAAYNAWREDRELEEQAELGRYLHTKGIDERTTAFQGIYVVEHLKGTEPLLRTGDLITIGYVAHALNGERFDDTYKGGTPLSFRLGDPGQVIRGLEIGLRKLGQGGKATFIIPSQYAFGADGSAAGIVPPFTTVVYELEVLERAAPELP